MAAPKVWLNTTQTLTGATQMTVTGTPSATSITFTDPFGGPVGSLYLGVENETLGGGDANTAWIAVDIDIAAKGTPSIASPTATGVTSFVHKPSGNATVEAITTTGVAGLAHDASGDITLGEVTSSATVIQTYKPSGAVTLNEVTSSAAVVQTHKPSGAVTLNEVTSSATVVQTYKPSGAATLEAATASGIVFAGSTYTAIGGVTLEEATADGVALRQATTPLTSSGDISISSPTATSVSTLAPKVWLNATQTGFGATEMSVTSFSNTSITFDDAAGAPVGNQYLAVENKNEGESAYIPVYIASTGTKAASGNVVLPDVTASGLMSNLVWGTPEISVVTPTGIVNNFSGTASEPSIDAVTALGYASALPTFTGVRIASGDPSLTEVTATGVASRTGAGTAVVIGTATEAMTEAQVVVGGKYLIITVTNDTFVEAFGADNAITDAFIDGIDSNQEEASGWDAVVKANLTAARISREAANIAIVLLPPSPTYSVTTNEIITITIPGTSLTSGAPITVTPTFTVTAADPAILTAAGAITIAEITSSGISIAGDALYAAGSAEMAAVTANGTVRSIDRIIEKPSVELIGVNYDIYDLNPQD